MGHATGRGTARDRLRRILYLLPAAGAEEGARIEDLCEALGVSREVLLDDIAEVTAREYYQPAGRGDSLRISLERDRVRVRTTGEFRRPPRLDAREKFALGMGLRVLAAEREGEERESLLALAERLEDELASVREIEFAPTFTLAEASLSEEEGGDAGGAGGVSDGALRGLLLTAARDRRGCAFRYTKPGAAAPEDRRLEPYLLVASGGRWYAVGRDPDRDGIRAFRLDRMLELSLSDERFEPDPGFDIDRYLTGGYVFHPPEGSRAPERAARVRYAPSIARWILEREGGDPREDGSALLEHDVRDPAWAVRHVLRYGGDAELLGPADLRARVAESARRAERRHAV